MSRKSKTIDDKIAATDARIASLKEQQAELRKLKRRLEREAKAEAERKAREVRQAEALAVLAWLETHTFGRDDAAVNALDYVRSLMRKGADSASADSAHD